VKQKLPLRILLPILALVIIVAVFAVVRPGWTAVALLVLGLVTLSGGAAVLGVARRGIVGGARPLVRGTDRFVISWVVVTALLWAMCAPDVYVRDAGELAGAAIGLGVPHPTGFPILCMLGKLFSLGPVGNVFFRMNLLSGFAAGGVAAFAWLFVDRAVRRSASDPGPLWWAGPMAYLGSAAAWLHGVTPEIYSIAALGLAATIFLALQGIEKRDARWLAASAVLCGAGLGGHVTWPVYGTPALVVSLIAFAAGSESGDKVRSFFRVGFICLFAAVVGAMIVFYLPSAASRDPLMNWGDPSTFQGMLDHLSGRRIRDSFGDRIGSFSPAVLAVNASLAWRSIVESMGPVLPFSAVGVIMAATGRSKWALAPACLVIADFMFAVLVNPMGIRDLQVLLVATWSLAVLAGIGVASAVRLAATRAGRAGALGTAALAAMLILFQWAGSPADRDMRNVFGPRIVSDRVLDSAPAGAVALTASDDLSAVMMARSAAEDARPDMTFLVKQHLSDTRYVVRRLNPHRLANPGVVRGAVIDRLRSRPLESGGESAPEAVGRAVDLFDDLGPVLYEPGEGGVDAGVMPRLVPGFPLWTLDGSPDSVVGRGSGVSAWRDAMSMRHVSDRWGRAYLAEWTRLYGTSEALALREENAMSIFRAALLLDPYDYRAAHNLGVLLADAGRYDAAIDWFVSAVSSDPGYVRGWKSLARVAAAAGRSELQREAEERVRSLSER